MLADPTGTFTQALGLGLDLTTALGGIRCTRFRFENIFIFDLFCIFFLVPNVCSSTGGGSPHGLALGIFVLVFFKFHLSLSLSYCVTISLSLSGEHCD